MFLFGIGFRGLGLLVIVLSGILEVTQISTKIIVPAISIEYKVLPHFLIIGTIQNSCNILPIKNNIPTLILSSMGLGALTRCNIPAIKVVPSAA